MKRLIGAVLVLAAVLTLTGMASAQNGSEIPWTQARRVRVLQ